MLNSTGVSDISRTGSSSARATAGTKRSAALQKTVLRNLSESLGLMMLTTGTTTNPPIMARAPQSIGFIGFPASMLITVMPTPHAKHAQTAARVTPRQYKPSMNGARKAPASAPHEMPISCAMNVGGLRAIISESAMKKRISTRMTTTLRRSMVSTTESSI